MQLLEVNLSSSSEDRTTGHVCYFRLNREKLVNLVCSSLNTNQCFVQHKHVFKNDGVSIKVSCFILHIFRQFKSLEAHKNNHCNKGFSKMML